MPRSHVGADEKHSINFHWFNLAYIFNLSNSFYLNFTGTSLHKSLSNAHLQYVLKYNSNYEKNLLLILLKVL